MPVDIESGKGVQYPAIQSRSFVANLPVVRFIVVIIIVDTFCFRKWARCRYRVGAAVTEALRKAEVDFAVVGNLIRRVDFENRIGNVLGELRGRSDTVSTRIAAGRGGIVK